MTDQDPKSVPEKSTGSEITVKASGTDGIELSGKGAWVSDMLSGLSTHVGNAYGLFFGDHVAQGRFELEQILCATAEPLDRSRCDHRRTCSEDPGGAS
ncbi:MAG: hypothetical protein ACPGOY_14650 [Rhodospirillaceae bacterium]